MNDLILIGLIVGFSCLLASGVSLFASIFLLDSKIDLEEEWKYATMFKVLVAISVVTCILSILIIAPSLWFLTTGFK